MADGKSARREVVVTGQEAAAVPAPRTTGMGIPVTHDGLPDIAAMESAGLETQLNGYAKRVRAVSRVEGLLYSAKRGRRSEVWARVAGEVGMSVRTLRGWAKVLREEGHLALVPTKGLARRGTYRSIPPELQRQVLDAFCYGGRYSIAQIVEHVVLPYCEQHEVPAPHPRTVGRFLADPKVLPPMIRDFAREGVRYFQEHHEVRVTRDLESAGTNEWWCADHRIADTFVLVADGNGAGWAGKVKHENCPCGSGEERAKCCSVRRPWWTLTVDIGSAAIVSLRLSLQPNAAVVAHGIRDAILSFGVPRFWVRDNGREFTAGLLTGKTVNLRKPKRGDLEDAERWPALAPEDVETSTIWPALGVRVVTALPYSSWSKYAESVFSAFSRRYENLLPGWCGRSTEKKPEKLGKEIADGELLSLDEYAKTLRAMVDDWNSKRPIGRRTLTPLEHYVPTLYTPKVPDAGTLGFLLQTRKRLKVQRGSVKLGEQSYISDELSPYSGDLVEVRYDGADAEWIFVYPATPQPGKRTCFAVQAWSAEYGEWTEANLVAQRARRAQRRAIRDFAVEIKGACPVEGIDPFGAHRAVRVRLAKIEKAAREERKALAAAEADDEDDDLTVYDRAREQFRAEREGAREQKPEDGPHTIYYRWQDTMVLDAAASEAADIAAKKARGFASAADRRDVEEWEKDLRRRLAGVRSLGRVEAEKTLLLYTLGYLPPELAREVKSWDRRRAHLRA